MNDLTGLVSIIYIFSLILFIQFDMNDIIGLVSIIFIFSLMLIIQLLQYLVRLCAM